MVELMVLPGANVHSSGDVDESALVPDRVIFVAIDDEQTLKRLPSLKRMTSCEK